MISLFEYGKWENIKNKETLCLILKDIWAQRLFIDIDLDLNEEEKDNRYQPFLKFDGNEIRANNYIGFIQNGEELIEIYPKVFRQCFLNPSESEKRLMLRHIFYWFGYCRKWNFPFNKASLDTIEIDNFPELIINLIAQQFLETISAQPLTMYQEVEEALTTPRGTINFNRYINKSLTNGNFQNIECDYEPFLFDNKVNRIIKYCTRLLMAQTKFSENIKTLQDVIFILDEVEDLYCSWHDLDNISLNTFFEDYSTLLDSCKLILSQQLYSGNTYDFSQWCLLFPMEYIFEDFLAGFLEIKFSSDWKIEYQKSNLTLSNTPKVFKMQHDIFLTSKHGGNRKVIIDTKYKIRSNDFKEDPKKGVAQSDLYQMVSYAFKRGCTDIILIYPNISDAISKEDSFEIISGFNGADKVNIIAMEIPFWTKDNFSTKYLDDKTFEAIKNILDRLH